MLSTTVIVITLNRPKFLEQCLRCLQTQTTQPHQIIVVDASEDKDSLLVTQGFPGALYLRNDGGFGRMTTSRNIALGFASGEIIAFLDDDAFAAPEWLGSLLATYTDPSIGAVGGRARNNQPDEDVIGINEIGRLLPNGTHTGHFAADPGHVIEVDHIIGCNMSFRREVLARLGGFREDYPGISGVREDTDMSIRVKKLGYRVLFNPAAVVEHVGAPQAIGRRFDARYAFYSARNHTVMLLRNYGLSTVLFWRYLAWTFTQSIVDCLRRAGGAAVRLTAVLSGTLFGIVSGLQFIVKVGVDPVRHDAGSEAIRSRLQKLGSEHPIEVAAEN